MSTSAASLEPYPREGLPLEEARRQVLAALTPLAGSESLPLQQALGRVTAESVVATEAVPGFRASIMDGYALAAASVPQVGHSWPLMGRSAPGAPYPRPLAEGEAIRILTGAPLPEGAAGCCPRSWWKRMVSACASAARRGPTPGSAPPTRRPAPARSCWAPECAWGPPIWAGWPAAEWRS